MATQVLTTELVTTVSVLAADGGRQDLIPVPAASLGGGSTRIVWRSDGTGDAITWVEVFALIAGRPSIEIYVDENLVILPVTAGVWPLNGAWFSCPRSLAPILGIQILDGATLVDCAGADGGIFIECLPSVDPSFAFTIPSPVPVVQFFLRNGATVQNSGSVPAIEVGSGDFPGSLFLLRLDSAGSFNSNPAVPVLNATAVLIFCVVTEQFLDNPLGFNTLSSDASSALGFVQDGTLAASPSDWALFLGTVANSSYAQDGGFGSSAFRPINLIGGTRPGCIFYDTTENRNLFWDGIADWQTLDVVGVVPGKRSDQSVNSARVDNVYSTQPILRTQSAGNVAGGFNGPGTGNKAILGCRPFTFGIPLAAIVDFSFTFTDLLALGLTVYANWVLDLNGDQTAYAVGVIDPAATPGLLLGAATFNPDGSETWSWNPTFNMMVVNGLKVPPNPPGGPGFVPPTITLPGPPLPVGWQNNSYSVADVLAAYPACVVRAGDTLDNGLPKSPNSSYPFLFIAGDSTNQSQRAFQLKRLLLNTVPI